MKTLRVLSIVIAAALVWASTASAEYNGAKLRQAAGGYLDAVHVATVLQQSRCGDYFQNDTDSFANAMGDIASYLDPKEVEELRAFLQSDEYRKAQATTQGFIDGWIQSLADINGDEPIACKKVGASVAMLYGSAKETWRQVKASYGQ